MPNSLVWCRFISTPNCEKGIERLGRNRNNGKIAKSHQQQIQRKTQKTLKRESAANGQRRATAVVAMLVLGRLLTLPKTAELESLVNQDSVETLLVPERILLKTRRQNLQRNSQLEVPLHLERKVLSSAISYERADARMETLATFGTHLFAETKPLRQDVL